MLLDRTSGHFVAEADPAVPGWRVEVDWIFG
jgi:hypothetical protein